MLAHDRGQAAELLRREVALRHLHLDGGVARLPLCLHGRARPLLEGGAVGVRGLRRVRGRGRGVGLLVVEEEQRVGPGVGLRPLALELGVHHRAERLLADAVDEELDARLGEVLAELVGGVEDAQHGVRVLEVLVDGDPLAQHDGVLRHDREAAAGDDAEAPGGHAVDLADLGDEAEVVDLRERGVLLAAGEGNLELAGQQLGQLAAHEVADEGAGVGGDVERLVVANACPGVAGDVAHGVAAGLAGGEARAAEHAQQLQRLVERDVVVLHVLARGEVAPKQRREALGDLAEGVELVRGDAAEGQLHADHLAIRLALPVDALAQAELGEVQHVAIAGQELGRLGGEVGQFVGEDRDHVARGIDSDIRGHRAAFLRRGLLLSPNPINNVDNLVAAIVTAGDTVSTRRIAAEVVLPKASAARRNPCYRTGAVMRRRSSGAVSQVRPERCTARAREMRRGPRVTREMATACRRRAVGGETRNTVGSHSVRLV